MGAIGPLDFFNAWTAWLKPRYRGLMMAGWLTVEGPMNDTIHEGTRGNWPWYQAALPFLVACSTADSGELAPPALRTTSLSCAFKVMALSIGKQQASFSLRGRMRAFSI